MSNIILLLIGTTKRLISLLSITLLVLLIYFQTFTIIVALQRCFKLNMYIHHLQPQEIIYTTSYELVKKRKRVVLLILLIVLNGCQIIIKHQHNCQSLVSLEP